MAIGGRRVALDPAPRHADQRQRLRRPGALGALHGRARVVAADGRAATPPRPPPTSRRCSRAASCSSRRSSPARAPSPAAAHRWSVPEAELSDGERAVAAVLVPRADDRASASRSSAPRAPPSSRGRSPPTRQFAEMLAAIVRPAGVAARRGLDRHQRRRGAARPPAAGGAPPGAATPAPPRPARAAARRLRRPLARRGRSRATLMQPHARSVPNRRRPTMTVMTRSAPKLGFDPATLPGDLFIGGAWRPGAAGQAHRRRRPLDRRGHRQRRRRPRRGRAGRRRRRARRAAPRWAATAAAPALGDPAPLLRADARAQGHAGRADLARERQGAARRRGRGGLLRRVLPLVLRGGGAAERRARHRPVRRQPHPRRAPADRRRRARHARGTSPPPWRPARSPRRSPPAAPAC